MSITEQNRCDSIALLMKHQVCYTVVYIIWSHYCSTFIMCMIEGTVQISFYYHFDEIINYLERANCLACAHTHTHIHTKVFCNLKDKIGNDVNGSYISTDQFVISF